MSEIYSNLGEFDPQIDLKVASPMCEIAVSGIDRASRRSQALAQIIGTTHAEGVVRVCNKWGVLPEELDDL